MSLALRICCCCCIFSHLLLIDGVEAGTTNKQMFTNFLWEHKFGLTDNQTMHGHAFLEMLDSLKIGSMHNITCSSSSSSSTDSHDHSHRRRRHADEFEPIETCLSGSAIAESFNANITNGITKQQMTDMAVAILQQLIGGFCTVASNNSNSTTATDDTGLTYLYGSLSVLVISLLSTIGCVLGFCSKSKYFDYLILFFVELAVGSLIGESTLHLLPAIIEGSHSHNGMPAFFTKILVVCGVLFVLHMVDTFSMCHGFESGHSHQHHPTNLKFTDVAEQQKKQDEQDMQDKAVEQNKGNGMKFVHPRVNLIDMVKKPKLWLRDPYRLCLFVLVGDAFHNFADGLAVGAAFVFGHSDGLRLSLTVALHELAHELADFAILLSSGFSVGAAVLLNFISALTAFIGLYVGIPLSQTSSELKLWILAFAAAMFIYIALVTMMNAVREGCSNRGIFAFLVGNFGLLIGFLCVIAISMYEFYGS